MVARRIAQLTLILSTSAFVYCVIHGPISFDREVADSYPPTAESRRIIQALVEQDEAQTRASAADLSDPVID